jgi:hypothetical protein
MNPNHYGSEWKPKERSYYSSSSDEKIQKLISNSVYAITLDLKRQISLNEEKIESRKLRRLLIIVELRAFLALSSHKDSDQEYCKNCYNCISRFCYEKIICNSFERRYSGETKWWDERLDDREFDHKVFGIIGELNLKNTNAGELHLNALKINEPFHPKNFEILPVPSDLKAYYGYVK